ncbi:MAG: hypothetical protein LBP39_02550 [Rickettsiales bacterium]|jgi:hypothetical protein|nr:hypothetical protein [Rickettsiales bacterium]
MEDEKTFDLKEKLKENVEDKEETLFLDNAVFRGTLRDGELFYGRMAYYETRNIFKGYFKDGKPSNGRMTYYETRNVFNGDFKDDEPSKGTVKYKDETIFKGDFRDHKPSRGTMTYKNGVVFDGEFYENGKFSEGKIIYDGEIIEYKGENSQLSEGNGDYIISDAFKNKLDENGKPLDKVRIIFRNGDVFEGKLNEKGRPSIGKMMYINGNIFDGKFRYTRPFYGKMVYKGGNVSEGNWQNGQLYDGTKTHHNGTVYIGEWKNCSPLDVSVKSMLSNTRKLYCLYRYGRNNFQREIKYCLDDHNEVTINYEKINEILNKASSKINSLDDLVKKKLITGVRNFNDLKEFSKKLLQDKMLGDIEKGFEGAHVSLEDLLLLSSVDTVEQLKKTRFQLYYTKEGEDSLKKDYGSLKGFLESFGIDNINEVKEDYLSLKVDTIPPKHTVSVILDIKKMKDLMKETGKKDLDEAVASEKVIHCFDSSRFLGYPVTEDSPETCFNIGALDKNCDFVNLEQQELGSCWFHAVASTLTAMKYPELVEKIEDGTIELYDTGHDSIREGDKLNEFQLRQMNTIREISKKFDIGLTKDDREVIDLIIDNQTQEEVGKMPFPDVLREVLGIKTENKAEEMDDGKGQSDFSYRVRVIDGRNRAIEKLSKKTESNEKVILKELETQRGFLTQNGKRRGVDDNAVHYGKKSKFDTFTSREEKKRKNNTSVIKL